jgi:NADPH:quinone reductase-like Zn-dependent oxidoreductase
VLALVTQPLPRPGPRQLLVRVEATTVDSGDARIRSQRLPRGFGLLGRLAFGWRRPRRPVLGSVLAGTVVTAGAGVAVWRPGDAIVAATSMGGGGHAQWAALGADRAIIRRPEGLSPVEAASLVFRGLAAQYFLDRAAVKPSERLLVIGATGAVGSALLQQARARGLLVTALDSAPHLALARELGAAEALDCRVHPADTLGDGRFDVVADTCVASLFARCLHLLRPGGAASSPSRPAFRRCWRCRARAGEASAAADAKPSRPCSA